MDAIIRALFIYVFLQLLIRMSGKRSLAQITTFDFILLLIVGEATQQALLSDDFSLVNAAIVLTTLIGLDTFFSLVKRRLPKMALWADGTPTVILENGKPITERLRKERLEKSDILEAARHQGLARLDQIKYAVLEKSGGITIIPKN